MVLLCDVDHGLAHDLDLVITRREGRLVVTAPDGSRVWGTADAAFHGGVVGLSGEVDDRRFAGVQPLDTTVGCRPAATPAPVATQAPDEPGSTASISRLLFPDLSPDLPDAMQVNGEPMDLAYVVGVLLGNRDLERRLAAENAGHAGRLTAVA